MYNKLKIETKTNNIFIKTAILNSNSSHALDDNFFEIYYSLIEAQLHKNVDLNEDIIITNSDYYDIKVYKTNLFNILTRFNIESPNYDKFYKTLIDLGLNIEKPELIANVSKPKKNEEINIDFDNLDYTENKNMFSKIHLEQDLKIFLINEYLKKTSLLDVEKDIQLYNTLHDAIDYNQLEVIDFIGNIGVNINLLNSKNETSLMKVNKLETLKVIDKYNPDWSIKNNNEEAINLFTQIQDSEDRTEILDYAYSKLEPEPEIKLKKLEQSLIELVDTNKTKKEITDFIKKHNINNISNIVDKDGNNLLMLSLKHGKTSKCDIFSQCDYQHLNHKNENILKKLLQIKDINAVKVLFDLLKEDNLIYPALCSQIIENGFIKNELSTLPEWLFKKSPVLEKFFDYFKLEVREQELIYSLMENQTKNFNMTKQDLFYSVYLILLKKHEIRQYPSVDNLLSNIFEYHNNEDTKKFEFQYSYYRSKVEVYKSFLNGIENAQGLTDYREEVLFKFSHALSAFIKNNFSILDIEENQKEEMSKYLNDSISFLLENNITEFIDNVPREIFTKYFKNHKELWETIPYVDLNNLAPNKEKVKKGKKI